MKNFKKSITLISTLLTLAAPIGQANAAWVVGASASLGERSEFNAEVRRLAYRSAVVSFILGAVTGNAVFSTIFILENDSTVADFQNQLIESNDFLVDSPELSLDLAKKLHTKAVSTDLIKIENDKGLDLKELTLSRKEISDSLVRFGSNLDKTQISNLSTDLK